MTTVTSKDFPSRKAWLEYRSRPKGPFMRWYHQNKQDPNKLKFGGLDDNRECREAEIPFDRSRNAEKRQGDWLACRTALNERLARRRRESWRLERNRTDIARAYL